MKRLLSHIEQAVAHLPDPFSPESERRTLLDSIRYRPFPTDSDDRHALIVDRGQTAWWSLFDVQFRVNGELPSIAREAEQIDAPTAVARKSVDFSLSYCI